MNLNQKITPIPPVKCPVQYPQSRAMVSPTDEATKLASPRKINARTGLCRHIMIVAMGEG